MGAGMKTRIIFHTLIWISRTLKGLSTDGTLSFAIKMVIGGLRTPGELTAQKFGVEAKLTG
ncbi:MAG: hypothetical protein BGO39_20710 [Chloroflexi bacterium 54-19]|nr:MAG: hypothetical protein BGO39_20710 [Chloroflexi bacterium 54-19]